MDQKVIKDNLGRAKAFYMKGDSAQALNAVILALHEVVRSSTTNLPIPIRSLFREAIQLISRDKEITSKTDKAITYSPGYERNTLAHLVTIYNVFLEGEKESVDVLKKRKLRLDKAYNIGLRLLAANKVSEADQAFQEAVKCHKDEDRLFLMIARALCEAEQPVRASTYIKKALELDPSSEEAKELLASTKQQAS